MGGSPCSTAPISCSCDRPSSAIHLRRASRRQPRRLLEHESAGHELPTDGPHVQALPRSDDHRLARCDGLSRSTSSPTTTIDSEGVAALAPYRVADHRHRIPSTRPAASSTCSRSSSARAGDSCTSAATASTRRPRCRPAGPTSSRSVGPARTTCGGSTMPRPRSSTSGLPTGMWRNIGRPENALTGVGFITQGFDACTYYVRSAASHDERVAWIFAGLEPDAVIGDFGILQGGAAGYEIDRYEVAKGSPPHSVVRRIVGWPQQSLRLDGSVDPRHPA